MKPEEINELIAMVEAGQEVRVEYGGIERSVTLDDLYLARAVSAALAEGAAKLDRWMQENLDAQSRQGG